MKKFGMKKSGKKKSGMKKSNKKGFSLVEIIAAIAILAVLMTLAANAYNIYKRKARQQAYDTMAKSTALAAEDYLMEHAKEKYITFELLKKNDYIDTLQDPRYKSRQCTGIVINKVVQGSNQKQIDTLFQKVKLCCKNYKYQYDYTGEDVKVTEIENCNYVDGDEIDGVYKLVYKPQGGSACNPKSVIKKQGEEWGTLCVTTRTKYVFKGWNTKKNGSGSKITASTKVENKDINAYAIWNPIYTLKFDSDGGTTCNPASIDKEKGNKWGTLCKTTKTGYAFKGWNTKKSGKGSTVTSDTYAEKDLTVYAEWNPYYTLTFDSKGGTACNPGSITKEKGEKWETLCAPTRNGYVFKGWNTKEDGTGNTITEGTEVSSNIIAYAIWNPKYTLTYNSNGGTACNPATVIKENGKKWGTLCAPTRTGYTFQGWKSGSTTITKDSICSGNITVTADWKANCPSGYTPETNGTCTKTYPAREEYSCPSGGTLSGTNCVSSSTYSASVTGYSDGCSWEKDHGYTSKSDNQSGAVWSKNVECSASNEGETRKFYDCGPGKVSCRNPNTGRYNCEKSSCKSENLRYTYKMGTCTCYGSETYSCPSGGTLSGTTCTTSSSYAATKNYVCEYGDTRSETTCISVVTPS